MNVKKFFCASLVDTAMRARQSVRAGKIRSDHF